MEKYKKFLVDHFEVFANVIAILCAVIMFVVIVVHMGTPVNSNEMEHHYAQMEMIQQDITSIYKLENASINITDDGMTVTLNGTNHLLKGYFDENNNYLKAEVVDNRVGSNFIISVIVIFVAWGWGYAMGLLLIVLLFIPIWVYTLASDIKKKFCSKKQE